MTIKLEAFCRPCEQRMSIDTLTNKPWHGWRIDKHGKAVTKTIDNLCCPFCGSNDITYLTPLEVSKAAG